ncbi:MAG: discoidin domain-containing protein, partial [Anaerohalosphaera sp.]|nr:discoidin domain-containing protein [Anaerohalosphaera sp.]
ATDNNDDGKAIWQDAAIAYRRNTPGAYKAGILKKHPIAHIAMNFGSQATNPFYRVLDNAKKVWLYTDGLGQHIQFKGYQSEGHDSSHPDYGGNVGRRQGGRDALNFVMRRGHDFGVLSGVHINAQEYHKEARNFSYDIANKNKIGWSWLDESYLTDYRYDSAFGTLYPRLDAMRADLPWLDFVYLDVYYGRGWPGWRMHTKTNDLGIIQFTEFPGVMERAVIWDHVANDWTQAIWGKGDRSQIARFIYYSDKDTFKHDPVLRGTNCDGFMGWHAEQDMLRTIKSAMTVNLPTKYLQHFLLVKLDENSALFDNGAKVVVDGEISRMYGPDGQFIGSCRYEKPKSRPMENLVFIPWCPTTEKKIYHWNDKGGQSEWELPKSWSGKKSALLYRLTDLGRVFEREVSVSQGKVTLTGIEAGTPYVLYKEPPAALPTIEWSQGSLIADTGFDSHSFKYWKTADNDGISFANNNYGQTELVMGSAGGEVSQIVSGLEGGSTYAASVWVSVKDKQPATITVKPYVPTLKMPAINKETWKVVGTSSGDGKAVMDDNDKTYWHTAYGKTTPTHPHEIVIDFGKMLTLEGFVQTARPDMHNGVIRDYQVFVSKDGKSWKTAVKKGTFVYEGSKSEVCFKKPIDAKYFKLIALSEHKDGPWATLAELDMIGTAAADKDKQEIAKVSKTIDRTVLTNYTDQSSKYKSKWHRIKVLFDVPAGVDSAEIVLTAGSGSADSAVCFDDVRVVKSGRSKPAKSAKNVVLFEDFENVDEGWGPFMYGWQGPMNTHLSETNLPYTDDTIAGEFSLKTRSERHKGIIYRTVPATMELKANTKYRVSFEYLSDVSERYTFIAGSDDAVAESTAKLDLTEGTWKPAKATLEFETGDQSDWFIGVYKNSKEKGVLVIDNVLIEKCK